MNPSGAGMGFIPTATRRPVSRSRDVQVSAKKMCLSSIASSSSISVPQGWADLPQELLQSIILLLRSPQETLAFAATCHPWYAAFSSCLHALSLLDFFPPLLLRPTLPDSDNNPSVCFIDPLNTVAPRKCQIPWRTVYKMSYVGSSYGNIIYFHFDTQKCHLFDAFTGDEVESPRLSIDKHDHPLFSALTTPLASPDSNLLVQVGLFLFQWKVGSKSWIKNRLPFWKKYVKRCPLDIPVLHVAIFKGEIFAVDSNLNLYRGRFSPRFKMWNANVVWEDIFKGSTFCNMWLVVCSDMLLLIARAKDRYLAAKLIDLSSSPRWVKVERLENWAVFLSRKADAPAFACKNPEKWGGRSNCVYFCNDSSDLQTDYLKTCNADKAWGVVQLGEEVVKGQHSLKYTEYWRWSHIQRLLELTPMWVFPGVFSRIHQ
ncbi:hypothetical protein EJB05_56229 [Eragrostis curvula]|uniref:KIB1-4 beta-propeller domain-containing protein n=1 Tax=Eragrostis curvula TaxID=38414 RepID=A0A5J9SGP0_9POAL|nr:hypothetical protein EJB05_56229 [Eragrostis curvula]